MNIKKYETKEKEKTASASGTYECYKIVFTTDSEIFGRGINSNLILYYNTEVGFVRSETQRSKSKTGYMELIRVKK